MSGPLIDYWNGEVHVRNGGALPLGTTNPRFFAGAAAERERLDAEERRKSKPYEGGSGSDDNVAVLFGALLVGAVLLGLFLAGGSSSTSNAPVSDAAITCPNKNPFSVACSSKPVPSYWPVKLIGNRVIASSLNVREWGNTVAPVSDRLRRGDRVFTTVHTNSRWALVYYVDGAGERRHGFVLNRSIALDEGAL